MAVYSHRMISLLTTSLETMANTMFSKSSLVISGDEFLAAFVDPSHLSMLREVQQMCKPSLSSSAATVFHAESGETVNLAIQFGGVAPVILPQYVSHGFQPTCPQDIRDRFSTWINERLNFGMAFGDAWDAIEYLNDTCGDVEAMTLLLPCIPSIMAGITTDSESKTVKRAQKLASINRFGKLPRLPRQVTQRLAEVSALVNAVTLMQDAPDPSLKRHDALFRVGTVSNNVRANVFYQNVDPNTPVPVARFL